MKKEPEVLPPEPTLEEDIKTLMAPSPWKFLDAIEVGTKMTDKNEASVEFADAVVNELRAAGHLYDDNWEEERKPIQEAIEAAEVRGYRCAIEKLQAELDKPVDQHHWLFRSADDWINVIQFLEEQIR